MIRIFPSNRHDCKLNKIRQRNSGYILIIPVGAYSNGKFIVS